MGDWYCPECEQLTEVVVDYTAAGETSWSCSGCGFLLQSLSVKNSSAVENDCAPGAAAAPVDCCPSDGASCDAAATAAADSPLTADADASASPQPSSSPARSQTGGSRTHRALVRAFKGIAAMADRLHLVAAIKDRANEIYKKVEDQKPKGRSQDAILAACLYIACRQENKPCTVKEISSVVNGATKKEIGRAKEYIVKHVGIEEGKTIEIGTVHARDFMKRFCSTLGMTNQDARAAQEAVLNSEELDIRRSPVSVAAAVIYMITQLSNDKKLIRDISLATGVAEGTIKNSYWDLYPHASQIIPSWFVKKESLDDLLRP